MHSDRKIRSFQDIVLMLSRHAKLDFTRKGEKQDPIIDIGRANGAQDLVLNSGRVGRVTRFYPNLTSHSGRVDASFFPVEWGSL